MTAMFGARFVLARIAAAAEAGACEARDRLGPPHRDDVVRLEVVLFLPVEREDCRIVPQLELEDLLRIEDDRVAEREVRRDRDHRDRARRGENERPADGEAVGGAARRGRHDETVRPVDDQRFAVHPHGDADRADLLPSCDDHVVQSERPRELVPVTHYARV